MEDMLQASIGIIILGLLYEFGFLLPCQILLLLFIASGITQWIKSTNQDEFQEILRESNKTNNKNIESRWREKQPNNSPQEAAGEVKDDQNEKRQEQSTTNVLLNENRYNRKKEHCFDFLVFIDRLGLTEYYPNKLEVNHVIKTKADNTANLTDLSFRFVRNIIEAKFERRDKMVRERMEKIKKASIIELQESFKNKSVICSDGLSKKGDDKGHSNTLINPLDLTMAVFKCSSPMLKQILSARFLLCKLAIPVIYPELQDSNITMSLWQLCSVITEKHSGDGSDQYIPVDYDCPIQIVSCLRIGRPSISKSKLMNEILNDDQYHHIFFNKECTLGQTKRCISNGLIEATWHQPSEKNKLSNNLILFLNLRGDGLQYKQQLLLLSKLSTFLLVLLDIGFLDDQKFHETLIPLYENAQGVFLAIDAITSTKSDVQKRINVFLDEMSYWKKQTKFIIVTVEGTTNSITYITDRIRNGISELAQDVFLLSLTEHVQKWHLVLDENDRISSVMNTTKSILNSISPKGANALEILMPLQCNLWRSYSQKLKLVDKTSRCKSILEIGKVRAEMNAERIKQVEICKNLNPFMKEFIHFMVKCLEVEQDFIFFVMWIKNFLIERARTVSLEHLSQDQSDWQALKSIHDSKDFSQMRKLKSDKSESTPAETSIGFEHLCREMGQICEALSVCESIPSELTDITKALPEVAVKLLLMGHSFEIWDGDAENIPLVWVKSVLSHLKYIIGDGQLLTLTILGIQGPGKLNILNTIFGRQFEVSLGRRRSTCGAFLQLLHITKSTIPFNYAFVIDTEGLSASPRDHKQYGLDLELATFVIGLADITILNLEGDNAEELRDVLQISVHALLRLKLANERLNPKHSCYFIQHKVPNESNDNIMQDRKQFVILLEEITMVAVAQENITEIQSFSEVIDFDSEQHVLYFTDLWRGETSAKEPFLFRLAATKTMFLTITDIISKIEDLWRGILKDDFVISFRNSLEDKAYNCIEQHCQTNIWSLEKYFLECLMSEVKCILLNCKDAQELEKSVSNIKVLISKKIIKKANILIKDLNDFVNNNTLKNIMIQWVQHMRNRLDMLSVHLVSNAETNINTTKEEISIAKRKLESKIKREIELNDLIRNFGIEIRAQDNLCEYDLENKFNNHWSIWTDEIVTKDIGLPIRHQIELLLYERYPADCALFDCTKGLPEDHYYLNATKLEFSVDAVWISAAEHLSIHQSWAEKPDVCKKQTIDVLNRIFRVIDKRLLDLNTQDIRFDLAYVTEILDIVTREIADFSDDTNNVCKFNLLPQFRAMVVLHVVKYINVFFTRLNDAYNRKHCPKAEMEDYKGTAWHLFKNVVEFKTEEVIAVAFFREGIMKVVVDHVEKLLPIDIQEKILDSFERGKYSLIRHILIDLANEDNFEKIKAYITNPKEFAEKWIIKQTNKTLFVNKVENISVYVTIAKARVVKLFTQLLQSVSSAMDRCKTDKIFELSNWIQCFLDTNRHIKGLPISADYLTHVLRSKLLDLPSFHEMVVESLKDMESRIIEMMTNTDLNSVKWKENIISKTMNKLWGCTETCMFCKEPCMNIDKEHVKINQPHKCLQHRPKGIGGMRRIDNERLAIEFCNHSVKNSDSGFINVQGKTGNYQDYKTYFPTWDIPPDSDVSKYWMWLMNKYKTDLAEMHTAKLPDIPDYWTSISLKQAIESLN